MKNLLVVALIMGLLSACAGDIDDTKISCTENCTVFSGKIQTADKKGIQDVALLLVFRNTGTTLSTSTRKIAEVKTDVDGYFKLSAYLKEEELGEDAEGYFKLILDTDKISEQVSEQYLKPNEYLIGETAAIFSSIAERNLTFENEFIVPKKGTLKIKIQNFKPIIDSDYFRVNVHYSYTFLGGRWTTRIPWGGVEGKAIKGINPTEIEIPTIIGGETRIVITKEKNGILETSEQKLELRNSIPFKLEFDY